MSHEVETMAYAGELPWHGLGVEVSNDLTPLQMMEKADLDWEVEKVDAYVTIGDQRVKTGQQALVRSSDNTILTNVTKAWNPLQNEDAFNFFAEYVAAGDMEMHTAGSLKNGQIRVVCHNTLTMSLEASANRSVKVGHRTVFDPDQVKSDLGLAHEKFEKYKEMAQFLGSKRFSVENLIKFYDEVYPSTSRTADKVAATTYEGLSRSAQMCYDALETQPGAQYGEGSWWQAFNSVTYVTDHLQGRSAEQRLHNQWFGYNQPRKVKAAEKAVEYALVA